ncbi:LPXTG cell wall anchor domain-containing protein, partial [Actinomyces sp. HMSC065F11]
GKTIIVKAEPVDGFEFAPGAQTEWSWTAMKADKCNTAPAKPSKPLAKTGVEVAALAILGLGLGALGISAVTVRRRKMQ